MLSGTGNDHSWRAFVIPLEAKGLCSMAGVKGAREAIRNRQPVPPRRDFEPDLNDGKDWSEQDILDLKAAWDHGADLQELCRLLCRADWEAVGDKCAELGLDLKWQAQRRTGILARKDRKKARAGDQEQ